MHFTTLTTILAPVGLATAAGIPMLDTSSTLSPYRITTSANTSVCVLTSVISSTMTAYSKDPTTTNTTQPLNPLRRPALTIPPAAEALITTAPQLVARARDWRADRDRAISRGRAAGARGRAQGQEGRRQGQAARDRGRAEAAGDDGMAGGFNVIVVRDAQAAAAADLVDMKVAARGWQDDVASARALASSARSYAASVASSARGTASGAAAGYNNNDDDDEPRQHSSTAVPEPSTTPAVAAPTTTTTVAHEEPHATEHPAEHPSTVQVSGTGSQSMSTGDAVAAVLAILALIVLCYDDSWVS